MSASHPQPEVRAVRRSAEGVELDLTIPRTLELFPAHFPAFALLPGVVQIDWAIRFGREHLGVAGEFRGLRGLKFLHPVQPGARLVLALSQQRPGELVFSFRTPARVCAEGRALFGSAP